MQGLRSYRSPGLQGPWGGAGALRCGIWFSGHSIRNQAAISYSGHSDLVKTPLSPHNSLRDFKKPICYFSNNHTFLTHTFTPIENAIRFVPFGLAPTPTGTPRPPPPGCH